LFWWSALGTSTDPSTCRRSPARPAVFSASQAVDVGVQAGHVRDDADLDRTVPCAMAGAWRRAQAKNLAATSDVSFMNVSCEW
jgi:hypothetical protein